MSFRFYRRQKLFGGLGINVSTSGISWSIRGKGGQFSPKRISIRLGIPGLTYSKYLRRSSSRYEGILLISILGSLIPVFIFSFVGLCFVYLFFPEYLTIYKYLVVALFTFGPLFPVTAYILLWIVGVFRLIFPRKNVDDFKSE